jgi:hypothetical protein
VSTAGVSPALVSRPRRPRPARRLPSERSPTGPALPLPPLLLYRPERASRTALLHGGRTRPTGERRLGGRRAAGGEQPAASTRGVSREQVAPAVSRTTASLSAEAPHAEDARYRHPPTPAAAYDRRHDPSDRDLPRRGATELAVHGLPRRPARHRGPDHRLALLEHRFPSVCPERWPLEAAVAVSESALQSDARRPRATAVGGRRESRSISPVAALWGALPLTATTTFHAYCPW